MAKRYTGNIISATPQIPANNYQDTPASGVWGMYEVEDLIKRGLWPTLGNLDPGKFVENIFSTYLYVGNGSTQTITNGIDLSGEGGLVWTKQRTGAASSNVLVDTARGVNSVLYSDLTNAEYNSGTNTLTAFNNNGYDLGNNSNFNRNNEDNVSWTFRKHPKFFDVQTFTTTYNNNPNVISHNLESDLGCAIFKQRNSTGQGYNWIVWHRSLGLNKYLKLNETSAQTSDTNSIKEVDNSAGTISFGYPMSAVADRLVSGSTETTSWVGYFFAHNNNDGGFGPAQDQDIIKCGSYTGNGSSTGPEIDLGFEPQWVMIKRSDSTGGWLVIDTMRGWTYSDGDDPFLRPDSSQIEYGNPYTRPLATGFQPTTTSSAFNSSGGTYIYVAIRRGPMAVPTASTDVFDATAYTADGTNGRVISSTPSIVDLILNLQRDGNNASVFYDRTRGSKKELSGRLTADEKTASSEGVTLDTNQGTVVNNAGYYDYPNYGTENQVLYSWKRAPNYFDIVSYTGTGSSLTVDHNLGVEPDMIWLKDRSGTNPWIVQGKVISPNNNSRLELNDTMALTNLTTGVTALTSTSFTLGTFNNINYNNADFIAYLFASLDGISKVGTYTGDGNTEQNIDCGFTNGSRFVLIKKTSHTGSWFVFDSDRGIISGNSPYLQLNQSAAEGSSYNELSPYSSGFTVRNGGGLNLNFNGHTFVFYAIA